jgi:hypothetical protein
MDYETAAMWLDLIAGIAVVCWLASTWFAITTRRRCTEPVTGNFRSEAPPERLRSAFVAALSAAPLGNPLARTEIDSATATEIRWRMPRGPIRHHGVLRLAADGGGTRADYGILVRSAMTTVGLCIAAAGLIVLVGLYLMLRETALASANGAVRAQVIQMVQCVHLLWPPFLLAGIARGTRRRLGEEVERVLRNAAFA